MPMKVIKQLSKDIECELDKAEDYTKKAIQYKLEHPDVAQSYLNAGNVHMDLMKNLHDRVVALITEYKKEKGEPPAPMMAIYDYVHERFMEKAAAVKNLQDVYRQ